jgi:hypothetical protein
LDEIVEIVDPAFQTNYRSLCLMHFLILQGIDTGLVDVGRKRNPLSQDQPQEQHHYAQGSDM